MGGIPMGATIEAVGLRQDPETATQSGVVCIFCGLPTPVRASSEGTFATHLRRPSTRVSLVRCEACGKEALYHADEIAEFGEILGASGGSLWFAKDAI